MPHCDFKPRVFSLRMSHDRKFKPPCVIGPGEIISFTGEFVWKRKKKKKNIIKVRIKKREIGNNLELIRFEVN